MKEGNLIKTVQRASIVRGMLVSRCAHYMKIFHISEPKHGWIDVTFGEPPDAFTQRVSDVPNDCLRDLAAAIARLLQHSTHEVVEFSLEPVFMKCELHREANTVRVVLMHPGHDG